MHILDHSKFVRMHHKLTTTTFSTVRCQQNSAAHVSVHSLNLRPCSISFHFVSIRSDSCAPMKLKYSNSFLIACYALFIFSAPSNGGTHLLLHFFVTPLYRCSVQYEHFRRTNWSPSMNESSVHAFRLIQAQAESERAETCTACCHP